MPVIHPSDAVLDADVVHHDSGNPLDHGLPDNAYIVTEINQSPTA